MRQLKSYLGLKCRLAFLAFVTTSIWVLLVLVTHEAFAAPDKSRQPHEQMRVNFCQKLIQHIATSLRAAPLEMAGTKDEVQAVLQQNLQAWRYRAPRFITPRSDIDAWLPSERSLALGLGLPSDTPVIYTPAQLWMLPELMADQPIILVTNDFSFLNANTFHRIKSQLTKKRTPLSIVWVGDSDKMNSEINNIATGNYQLPISDQTRTIKRLLSLGGIRLLPLGHLGSPCSL